MTSIAPHIEAFLREYLVRHRGNSQHTCESYAYSFQALFEFTSQRLKVPPSAIALEQLDAALICSFLEHLEIARSNSGNTRSRVCSGKKGLALGVAVGGEHSNGGSAMLEFAYQLEFHSWVNGKTREGASCSVPSRVATA